MKLIKSLLVIFILILLLGCTKYVTPKSATGLSIGDVYGGGVIGHLYSDGKSGLIVTNGSNFSNWDGAVKWCDDLKDGGYDDWRLPTKNELNYLYRDRKAIGSFVTNYYWSSSEDAKTGAWVQGFTNGGQILVSKSNFTFARAVREFAQSD
jgi:hypothetical protein